MRQTAFIKRRAPKTPHFILKFLGFLEYGADLFRLRSLRPVGAVFHWQWIPVPALTVPLLCLFRVPVDVLTSHDLIPNGQVDRIRLHWVTKLSLRLAKVVIFHSAKLESEALSLAPFLKGKTRVIPHGLLF